MEKKYKKLIIIICMVFLGIIAGCIKTEAATASITANNKNVNVGDKVTITVNYNACLCQLKVSGSGISDSIDYIGTDLKNKSDSKSYTLNTSSAGTYKVSLTGSLTDENRTLVNINDSVTVVVSEKTTTGSNTNTGSNTSNGSSNSNNSNSNSTSTTTQTQPKFQSANDTLYATGNINVRKSYSTDSAILGELQTGDSVTRTGIGDNGWSRVTYNGSTGYIKTSLLTTEEPQKSSDKALKTLEITPEGLDPEFDPEVTTYTLIVGPDVEKLDIKAAPNDEKATVEITGNESFQMGDNQVKITVTAEDETTRIYNITVKKQETLELGLASLTINGYTLSPKFSSNVYEYKLNILDPSVTSLNITAKANDENAKVEISGNTSLQNGENTVVITVTSEDGKEKVIYQIYVNKSNMAGTTTNNKNNTIIYIGIGAIALIIIIIAIIIIKKRKNRNKEDDEYEDSNDYSDLYGYSSRNSKISGNEELNENNEQSADISKQNLENELFGKLPSDNINNNSEVTDKNNQFNNNEQYNSNLYNNDIYNNNLYNNIETNNISNANYNTTTETNKNEDNFNENNPYVANNIYGNYDYLKDEKKENNQNSELSYKDLYGDFKNLNYSLNQDTQPDFSNNNVNQNSFKNYTLDNSETENKVNNNVQDNIFNKYSFGNDITENKFSNYTSDNNMSITEKQNTFDQEDDYTLDDNYKIRRSKGKHSK